LLSSSNQAKFEWNAAGIGDIRNTYRLGEEELRGKRPLRDRTRCDNNNYNNNNPRFLALLKGGLLKK
jgi:hypothetical protein